ICNMEDIKKQYTIQWVGPFHSLEEARYHRKGAKNGLFATPDCFNFYYFRGNKKGRGYKLSKFYSYFGIHKAADGYHKRLNKNHEHYSAFHENSNMDIWIGALGDLDQYHPDIIEEIETIFIAMYGSNEFLTENDRKKKKNVGSLNDTVCIINLWYDTEEKPRATKLESIKPFHDVIVCERDQKYPRYLVANRLTPWKKK
ncbi:MAG: hypothetical protein K2J92_02910, partial [Muribaculaceae bacterium]|nr:hypothetical protein [Muribaculaceae bacterium]